MRKILTGALVLATAAVVSVVSPSADASAANATLTTEKVAVDATTQTLKVTWGGCSEVGFSVASVNAKTGIIKPAADAAWEWHDIAAGGVVVIDLSTLSNTKDNFVQLKTDNGEEMTIKIPSVKTKVKAVYDAAANTVTVQDTTDAKNPVAVADKVEFKNKYGNWTEYTGSTQLSSYVYKGAALTFRIAANSSTAIAAKGESDAKIEYQISKTEKEEVSYYVANAFPGKEVKVSVKKLANGPKVAANYVKNTITVPKGAQYRINLGEWTTPTDNTKPFNLDAATVAATAGNIEVRTAAVAAEGTKAGKPASKVSRLSFNAIEELAWVNTDPSVADFTADKKVKGDIALAYVGTEADKAITVEYMTATNKKTGVVSTTGIKIINKSANAYQVYVNKAADGVAPAIGVKGAVSVGAATFNKTTNEMTKAKEVIIKNCDAAQIFITKVGNAKEAKWATTYVGLGTVKYPADVVPTPSPEPIETPAE